MRVAPCGVPAAIALALVAIAAIVVADGSLTHVHTDGPHGLYNEEHDLTALASFAVAAVLGPPSAIVPVLTAASLFAPSASPVSKRRGHRRHSRAPPVLA
jgi:hypothetical protein